MASEIGVSGGVPERLRGGGLSRGGFRILDAGPEKADQRLADRLPRLMDIAHGQLALVELPILDLPSYGLGDYVFDALGCGLRERLNGGLDRVGEHHDSGLLGTG